MTVDTLDTRTVLHQIETAKSFFAPAAAYMGVPLARSSMQGKPQDSIFKSLDHGLGAFLDLEQAELPPDLVKLAQTQRRNMLDLMGVGSAWLRAEAEEAKKPELVFDPAKIMEMYSSLPLLAYTGSKEVSMSEEVWSVEIAGKLLSRIIGFTVAGGTGLADFRNFLTGLQSDIRAGVEKTRQTFRTFTTSMAFVETPRTHELEARLDGFLVDFTTESKLIDVDCASAQKITVDFKYTELRAPFRYHRLQEADIAKKFKEFIDGADIDDIERAKNKFKKRVKKA